MSVIVPLESERTQVHLDADRSDRKIEKWQTAALEAAKQCGNPWLPEIGPVTPASAFMESAAGYDLKLIASLQPGARSLKAVLAEHRAPANVLLLVGPEGDFTPAEMSRSRAAGFEPITLGPLVLRCEDVYKRQNLERRATMHTIRRALTPQAVPPDLTTCSAGSPSK